MVASAPPATFTGWLQPSKSNRGQAPFMYICGKEGEPPLNHAALRVAGAALVAFAVVVGGGATYALVVSKLLPPTGVAWLDWVRADTYYCVLVPILIPVTILKVYSSWLAMKFFKHA